MKKVLFLSLIVLSACSHSEKVKDPSPGSTEATYSQDQMRRSCWRGVKKACGKSGACYEKTKNYCETDAVTKF